MNNDMLKKLSVLSEEKLSTNEREELRMRMIAFMEEHPVIKLESLRHPYREAHGIATPPLITRFRQLKQKRMIPLIIGAMLALSGGAGVSYAAEGALPGDTLYPVKIHVNEEIQSAFALSPKAEAALARKKVERRAAEAASLAAEHKLDAQAKLLLASETEIHLNSHKKAHSEMEDNGDTHDADESDVLLLQTIDANADVLLDIGVDLRGRSSHRDDSGEDDSADRNDDRDREQSRGSSDGDTKEEDSNSGDDRKSDLDSHREEDSKIQINSEDNVEIKLNDEVEREHGEIRGEVKHGGEGRIQIEL